MATIHTEKYTRINLMLLKDGTKLMKRLFLQRINDLSIAGQEYTVDEFLNNNKTKILQTTTGKNKSKTLYPSSGNTNLDEWDLYLYCFVLEELCELEFINKKDVEKLQKMRNKLCHVNEPTLTNDEFEERLEKLKIIFTRSLSIIDDAEFAASLNADINNFETGPLSVNDIVKFNHEFSKIELQRLEIIANQTKMLDNQTTMMENQDDLKAMANSTMLLLADISKRLPHYLTVDIPTIQIIIEVNNCSGDPKESLLDFIMQQFNENISLPECNLQQEFPNIAMHKISEAVKRTFNAFLSNGRYLVKVEKKCLLLTITCKTVQSFVDLMRDCLGRSLPSQFEDLENAARNWEGCDNMVFEPVIYLKDIISAMYELVKSLDTNIPKGSQDSTHGLPSAHMISDGNRLCHPESKESLSTRQNQCLQITIRPVTNDGRQDFNTILKSGNVQRGLQEIHTEMKKEPNYSEVKIRFQVSGSEVFGLEASQNVEDIDENVLSEQHFEDAMNNSTQCRELLPIYDCPVAAESFKDKKNSELKECYQKDKMGISIEEIERKIHTSICKGKTSIFTLSRESPPRNNSNGNILSSKADTKTSSAEVICDAGNITENVIYTQTIEEIDNIFHPYNDPDATSTVCLLDESFKSESELDSLNLVSDPDLKRKQRMSDTEVQSEPEVLEEGDISPQISSDLEKHEYRNWVKGVKGLEYLQQGLAPFVDRVISAQHSIFKNKLPQQQPAQGACGCTVDNILIDHGTNPCKQRCLCKRKPKPRRICPNKFCSTLCQLILQEHRLDSPSWNNSNISNWLTDHWAIAACFMSETACPSTSAQSTDASGLLSIIINANFFQRKVTSAIGQPNDVLRKARDKRNELLHKGEMELSDNELQDVIGAFIDVLQDQTSLNHDQDAVKAVKKLEILKVDQIYISMAEEEEILNRRKEALNILKQLEQELEKSKKAIEETGVSAVESVDESKTNAIKELNEWKETAMADINEIKASDKDVIDDLIERLTLTEMKVQSLQERKRSNRNRTQSLDHDSDSSSDGESDNEGDETEFKLKTDENEIKDVDDVDITLREYQKELAVEGLKGNNIVIMAPTNTGKTRVACKIMQEHLRKRRESGKLGRVIFLVEKEALVLQQGEVCANLLPAYRAKVISGRVQRDKKQYLKDILKERDIFVVTAQVLVNSLRIGEIGVRDFSMMVFDECHHTTRMHPFNEIMRFYINMKLDNSKTELPQIIGLTASLGVGGSTSFEAGEKHMKTIMANLDAKCLCTVTEHTAELRKFANIAKEHIKVATKRENDNFRKAVLDIMHEIDKYMRSHKSMKDLPKEDIFMEELSRVPTSRGSESFQNWLSDFKDGIMRMKSDQARKIFFLCRNHLESYNKSLMLYADARAKDAVLYLRKFMKKEKKEFQRREKAYENQQDIELETDRFLLGIFEVKSFVEDEEENPKLRMMQDIAMRNLCCNDNTRGIIFVKTRKLALVLEEWMKETEVLQVFNAKVCIGQGHADEKGQTKKLQRQILKYFKKGQHRVIITTSVAEEGLDITKCNLVIRYEHVTNEIVRLQSRGRARAKNSRYYVITEEDSWIVDKEKKNAMLEKLMDQIIPGLQKYLKENPDQWEKEILDRQKERKQKEELKEKQRAANVSLTASKLHCQQCNAFICSSTDIRRIQQSQHVVIDESVRQRIKLTRKPISKYKNDILQYDGDTNCANEKCNFKLGGVCTYSGYEFPLISIAKFRVVNTADQGRIFKKWKDVNFDIIPFTVEELSQVVEERKEEQVK